MPKYDIVVVGAGNAGMSAALQCQLAGKKTLLIEKHNLPGGAATSFVRGRFEIEPSLHELCDFGPPDNPGDTRRILDSYGVKLNWHECKDYHTHYSLRIYRIVNVGSAFCCLVGNKQKSLKTVKHALESMELSAFFEVRFYLIQIVS